MTDPTWEEVPMFVVPETMTDHDDLERMADWLLAANGSMVLVGDDAMDQGDTILVDPNQLTMMVDNDGSFQ